MGNLLKVLLLFLVIFSFGLNVEAKTVTSNTKNGTRYVFSKTEHMTGSNNFGWNLFKHTSYNNWTNNSNSFASATAASGLYNPGWSLWRLLDADNKVISNNSKSKDLVHAARMGWGLNFYSEAGVSISDAGNITFGSGFKIGQEIRATNIVYIDHISHKKTDIYSTGWRR